MDRWLPSNIITCQQALIKTKICQTSTNLISKKISFNKRRLSLLKTSFNSLWSIARFTLSHLPNSRIKIKNTKTQMCGNRQLLVLRKRSGEIKVERTMPPIDRDKTTSPQEEILLVHTDRLISPEVQVLEMLAERETTRNHGYLLLKSKKKKLKLTLIIFILTALVQIPT